MTHRRLALAAAAAAALCACTPHLLNPFGKPYDDTNVIGPGWLTCEGGLDQPAYLVSGSKPIYPVRSGLNAEDGDVAVSFKVDAAGKITPLTVAEGPNRFFISHLQVAMTDWVVRPATLSGQPVDAVCTARQGYRLVGPWAPMRDSR